MYVHKRSLHRVRVVRLLVALAGCVSLLAGPLPAAQPAAAQSSAPQIVSPEVVHTGKKPTGYEVTFRYYSPEASRVRILGQWYFSDTAHTTTSTSAGRLPSQWRPGDFVIPHPNTLASPWPVADMKLDPSTGIWTYTTPLPSGVFTYAFYVNCAAPAPYLPGCKGIADPANPPWNTPAAPPASNQPESQVYVPSDQGFASVDYSWMAPNPVHGTLADVTYPTSLSTYPPGSHPLAVYIPPGYDPKRAVPYPTLYLSHGATGNELDWSTKGVAGNIVDNLIASRRAQPMLVVMTNFTGISGGGGGYARDVINNVIPYVEAHYNVSKKASDRAFGGLSMGGTWANVLLFYYTTAFGAYSVQSNAGGYPASAGEKLWQNSALKTLLGLQIGSGVYDPIRSDTTDEEANLRAKGIPFVDDSFAGGHDWEVWRIMLHDFAATMAFKHTTTSLIRLGDRGGVEQREVVYVEARVTADTSEPARPAGEVQFYLDGEKLDRPVPLLPAGIAKLALPNLGAGGHAVTAIYLGNNFYSTSKSELTVTR